ncbi:ABC-type transport auxiliary lipoprotein family protein [Ahrensia kielensis]|uniref:ABC-type transport auxiliary lipoprotein family protein n=1 Tax=Ahrensia kielensis TaxID=76980 RepID=UPI00039D0CE2|nr:ABC-type transport auxiliary lipoprotein family protein [Ahrensia kielensis]
MVNLIAETRFFRGAIGAIGFGLLSGCAAIGGQKAISDTFELSAAEVTNAQSVRRGSQILIVEPVALKALDSENIVIETSNLTIQYLSEAQWSDRLPRVVQQKIATAFDNSNKFAGIGLPGQGLAIDYQLITEIREFGVVATGNRAKVTIAVKLLNDRTGNVISSQVFSSTANAGSSVSSAYVRALDTAFKDVSEKMVVWVTTKI